MIEKSMLKDERMDIGTSEWMDRWMDGRQHHQQQNHPQQQLQQHLLYLLDFLSKIIFLQSSINESRSSELLLANNSRWNGIMVWSKNSK